MPDFADKLAAAIEQSGLSRAEVARRAGMTRGRLNQLLHRHRDPVGRAVAVMTQLAEALEIPMENLWGDGD